MLKKYKTCSVPLGRACQHVNLMVTQFESVRTRWFLLPKKITNAFTRVNFSDASARVQTYDETSAASRRVYFSNAFACVQTRSWDASGRIRCFILDAFKHVFCSVSNASKMRFQTRLYPIFFYMGLTCIKNITHYQCKVSYWISD